MLAYGGSQKLLDQFYENYITLFLETSGKFRVV